MTNAEFELVRHMFNVGTGVYYAKYSASVHRVHDIKNDGTIILHGGAHLHCTDTDIVDFVALDPFGVHE